MGIRRDNTVTGRGRWPAGGLGQAGVRTQLYHARQRRLDRLGGASSPSGPSNPPGSGTPEPGPLGSADYPVSTFSGSDAQGLGRLSDALFVVAASNASAMSITTYSCSAAGVLSDVDTLSETDVNARSTDVGFDVVGISPTRFAVFVKQYGYLYSCNADGSRITLLDTVQLSSTFSATGDRDIRAALIRSDRIIYTGFFGSQGTSSGNGAIEHVQLSVAGDVFTVGANQLTSVSEFGERGHSLHVINESRYVVTAAYQTGSGTLDRGRFNSWTHTIDDDINVAPAALDIGGYTGPRNSTLSITGMGSAWTSASKYDAQGAGYSIQIGRRPMAGAVGFRAYQTAIGPTGQVLQYDNWSVDASDTEGVVVDQLALGSRYQVPLILCLVSDNSDNQFKWGVLKRDATRNVGAWQIEGGSLSTVGPKPASMSGIAAEMLTDIIGVFSYIDKGTGALKVLSFSNGYKPDEGTTPDYASFPDISTAKFTNEESPLIFSGNAFSLFMSPDESQILIGDATDDALTPYYLETPGDLSTLGHYGDTGLGAGQPCYGGVADPSGWQSVQDSNGSTLITRQSGVPWALVSNKSTALGSNRSYSTDFGISLVRGLTVSEDGLRLFVFTNTGVIRYYTMANPFDFVNLVPSSDSADIDETGFLSDLQFRGDGLKMYALDAQTDTIYQYSLSSAYDLLTVSYDNISVTLTSQDSSIRGFHITPDGQYLYAVGVGNGGDIYKYTLG